MLIVDYAGKNVEILKTLTLTSDDPRNSTKKLRAGSLNNILMDLRKYVFQLSELLPLMISLGAYSIPTLYLMTSSQKV